VYSEVHATVGWLLAQPVDADRNFRASVTLAGLAPDLDAATYLLGPNWFSRYHHVWTHNLFFGLAVSCIAASCSRERRTRTFLFTQLAFWAHYFGDYFFSRMPIAAFWPLSDAKFGYVGALALWHPFNHLLVWVSLVALALVALRLKRTPLEILSPNLDARFVNFFFRRRDTPCGDCGKLGNETCATCGKPVCGNHAAMGEGFEAVCVDCKGTRD